MAAEPDRFKALFDAPKPKTKTDNMDMIEYIMRYVAGPGY